MAITQVGNISFINQNIHLNSQIQSNNINHYSAQNNINMQNFNSEVEDKMKIRTLDGVDKINDDRPQNRGNQNQNNRKHKQNKENSYPKLENDEGILDIKV